MNKTQLLTSAIAICGIATVAITTARAQVDAEPSRQQQTITKQDGRSTTTTHRFNAAAARKLRLNMEFGSVTIKASDRQDVVATLTKKVRDTKDAASREWLKNEWLGFKLEGDTIVVHEKPSLKPEIRDIENVELVLEVPNGLDAEVDLDAGEVTMSGRTSALDIQIDAGSLDLLQLTVENKLALHVSAGQITADLTAVPKSGCKLTNDVGEIVFNAGGGANINASVALGSISGGGSRSSERDDLGDEQEIKLGNGGAPVTLRVETGSIVIGKATKDKGNRSFKFDDGKWDHKNWNFDKDNIDQDVRKEIEKAMGEVERELKNVELDIENEMKGAMVEAEKEMASAEKEMAMAEREMQKAMKDMDFKFDSKVLNDKEIESIVRTAMAHAKKSVERSMAQAKKSIERMKASQAKRKGKD